MKPVSAVSSSKFETVSMPKRRVNLDLDPDPEDVDVK